MHFELGVLLKMGSVSQKVETECIPGAREHMGLAQLTQLPDSAVEGPWRCPCSLSCPCFSRGCIFTADPSHLQAKHLPCVEFGEIPYFKTVN